VTPGRNSWPTRKRWSGPDVRGILLDAAHRYVTEVATQDYPDPAHSYT
jgi:ketopantoate hydroxymethyltransferase